MRHNYGFAGWLGLGLVTLLIATPAWAVSTVSSSSFGESVNLVFLATGSGLSVPITFTSGPVPTAAGTAPAPYNVTNSLATVSAGTGLQAGPLTASASSSFPLLFDVAASATASNVVVSISPLVNVTASEVQSTAMIDSALTASGTTNIANGTAGPAGPLPAHAAPNTVFMDTNGVKVILNQQTLGGNGVTSRDLTINAVDITFINAPFSTNNSTGVLNGEIILAHSETHAQGVVATVPEPSCSVLLASGVGVFAMWRARKKFDMTNRSETHGTTSTIASP